MLENTFSGLLELNGRHGGWVRKISLEVERFPNDPHLSAGLISQYRLRPASMIECTLKQGRRGSSEVENIKTINGLQPAVWASVDEFSSRTAIDPNERIKLTAGAADPSMRVIDLLCPIGRGQRALIVSPPKAGKTILMQQHNTFLLLF